MPMLGNPESGATMNQYPEDSILSARQKALFVALEKKHADLAKFYLGALITFNQDTNPDHLAQAAHSLRELMEKIPKYLEVPKKDISLKEKARQLETSWTDCAAKSNCFNEGKWSGDVDGHLARFLCVLQEFFDWFIDVEPTIKKRVGKTLRVLDPSVGFLPSKIETLRINEWNECNYYFQGISHHTKSTEKTEFISWLSVLEKFLLDRLEPETFKDFDLMDSIIREGESNG